MMTSPEVVFELAYVSVRTIVELARYVTLRYVAKVRLIVRLVPENGTFLMESRLVEYWWCHVDDLLLRLAFLVATLHPSSCYLAPHRHSLLSIDRF